MCGFLFSILITLLGLLIGSFLNVVAIRIPQKESISFPPSHCVHCKHRLGPLELIPVLSYVCLKGRCRHCREKISPQYPLVEAVTAILFGLVAGQLGAVPELAVGLMFISILIAIVVTDIRYRLIPDRIVFFGMIVGLIARIFFHPLPLWSYAAGFLIGGGIMFLLAWVSKGGMGGGDIKLFALIGLILGVSNTLMAIFLSSLLGMLYGTILMGLKKATKKSYIPFGPFIALGTLIAYLWGKPLIDWYVLMVLQQ